MGPVVLVCVPILWVLTFWVGDDVPRPLAIIAWTLIISDALFLLYLIVCLLSISWWFPNIGG